MKSVTPLDQAIIANMPAQDARLYHQYFKAMHHHFEVDQVNRLESIDLKYQDKYTVMETMIEELKETQKELKKSNKSLTDQLRDAIVRENQVKLDNEELTARVTQTLEENAQLKRELAIAQELAEASRLAREELEAASERRLRAANEAAVRAYPASSECKKDIVALNSLAFTAGRNDALKYVEEAHPELKLCITDFGYDEEEASKFDFYLAQFQTTGDIKEIWLEDMDIDQGVQPVIPSEVGTVNPDEPVWNLDASIHDAAGPDSEQSDPVLDTPAL